MAVGVLRTWYECLATVYPIDDVRGRQQILREFLDELVALGVGFSIVDETVPTTNFTSSSTYYTIWVRYKNSDHLIRFSCQGGGTSGTTYQYIYCSVYKAGSIVNILQGDTVLAVTSEVTRDRHKFGLSLLYATNWFSFSLNAYDSSFNDVSALVDPVAGYVLEDFVTPATVSEALCFYPSAALNLLSILTYAYPTGIDTLVSPIQISLDVSASSSVEKIQKTALTSTNWHIKSMLAFSNAVGAVFGSIVTMNGNYYIVRASGFKSSSIMLLGPVP